GMMAYSASADRIIILWDVETGEMLRRFGEGMLLSEHFLAAAFTPDGKMLLSTNGGLPRAVEGHEANLILWDVETGEPLRIFRGHTTLVGRLAISPDGRQALTCGAYEEMILWDMETGEIIRQRDELSPEFNYLATDIVFLPDGQRALITFLDTTAMLIDLNTLEPLQTYGEAAPEVWAFSEFAVTRDYKTLYLSNFAQDDYALWDIETGDRLTSLPGLFDLTFGAQFLPDGESLLVDSDALGLREIAVSMGSELQHIKFDPWQPIGYKVTPDEQTVLINVGTEEACQYVVYDIASNSEVRRFGMDEAPLNEIGCMENYDFAFLPDGQLVLSSASEGPGILWDVQTGEIQMRIPDFPISPEPGTNWSRIIIHPDGQSAFTASLDGRELIQWDLTTGAIHQQFKPPFEARPFFWVDLSPDGESVIAVLDQGIACWDIATGEITCDIRPSGGAFLVGYYHPNGEQVVTINIGDTSGSTITVWDIATGAPVLTFTPPTLVIGGLAFTPDGRYAVLGQPDVSIWDLTTGQEIRRYPLGSIGITFAAYPYMFSDGRSFFVQAGIESGSRYLYRLRID
ncbi:MAG: WD40 repeat domain-containing protein, partial [Anaerolineae bacterium]|nr:WD40 repeat domain-containing protein [Anaerolineae bacterium]